MRAGATGTITPEEREYYIAHYMSEEEKEIGKPLFEMTSEEEARYKVLSYNNSAGTLAGYDCPVCHNKGDIMIIKHGYEYYRECECMKIRRAIERMKRSGLYNLLNVYTFNKYECAEDWQSDIFNKAKKYAANSDGNKWFVFLGSSGIGKSHICTAISRELMLNNAELYFMPWLDESVELKQNIVSAPEEYRAKIEQLKTVEVLYIDDFFKSENNTPPTAADIKLANEILNYRYNKARMQKERYLTIISSERTIGQLMEYDKAIAGRIIEMSKPDYLITINDDNKNYRLRGLL